MTNLEIAIKISNNKRLDSKNILNKMQHHYSMANVNVDEMFVSLISKAYPKDVCICCGNQTYNTRFIKFEYTWKRKYSYLSMGSVPTMDAIHIKCFKRFLGDKEVQAHFLLFP